MSAPIVAIGGGGVMMEDQRGIQERYLLSLLRKRSGPPRVLFLDPAPGVAP